MNKTKAYMEINGSEAAPAEAGKAGWRCAHVVRGQPQLGEVGEGGEAARVDGPVIIIIIIKRQQEQAQLADAVGSTNSSSEDSSAKLPSARALISFLIPCK